jgi:hypothetical protein
MRPGQGETRRPVLCFVCIASIERLSPSCPYRHDAISDLSPWHCKCPSPPSPLPSGASAVASTTSHPASRLDCGLNLMCLARRVLPPCSVHVHSPRQEAAGTGSIPFGRCRHQPSNADGPRIHGARSNEPMRAVRVRWPPSEANTA